MEEIAEALEVHPLVIGGGLLMVWGWVLWLIRATPTRVYKLLHRRYVMDVIVHNTDEAFYWVEKWLAEHGYSDRSTLVTVLARPLRSSGYMANAETEKTSSSSSKEKNQIEPRLVLGPGRHLIRYGGKFLLIYRERGGEKADSGGGGITLFIQESFRIRYLGRDQETFRNLLKEARDLSVSIDDRLKVFFPDSSWWYMNCSIAPRARDSLILKKGQLRRVLDDIEEFIASEDEYRRLGIPYRRGFLLHGPPGTGKTSLVHVVASALNRAIYVVPLGSIKESELAPLLGRIPKRSVILLEDVDAVHNPEGKDKENPITFSSFLNAVDGLSSSNGRIMFMTTNHPEVLNKALVRPGRVDLKEGFGLADDDMVKRMYVRFFPSFPTGKKLLEFTAENAGSAPAMVQERLIQLRGGGNGGGAEGD